MSKPCIRHREPCGSCKFPGVSLTENGGHLRGPSTPARPGGRGALNPQRPAPADGSEGGVSLVTPRLWASEASL